MKILPLVFLLAFSAVVAPANPIIISEHDEDREIRMYIAGEQLDVTVDPDHAVIDGQFMFYGPVTPMPAKMNVPIWIPAQATAVQPDLAAFLRRYPLNKTIRLEDRNRAEFDRLLQFSAVGRMVKEISVQTFGIYDTRGDQHAIPPEWQRAGKLCVVVSLPFEGGLGSQIHLHYAQPHVQKSGNPAEFFYLPKFANLPAENSTEDVKQYAMKVTPLHCSFRIGGKTFTSGKTALLHLRHYIPIVGEIVPTKGS